MNDDNVELHADVFDDNEPYCIVECHPTEPVFREKLGEYTIDVWGPYDSYAEAKAWLQYNGGHGQIERMFTPAFERARRIEDSEWLNNRLGMDVSLKMPPRRIP